MSVDLSLLSDSELHAYLLKAMEPLDNEEELYPALFHEYSTKVENTNINIENNEKNEEEKGKGFTFKPVAFEKTRTNVSEENTKGDQRQVFERLKMDKEKLAQRLERFGMAQEEKQQPEHKVPFDSTKKTGKLTPKTKGESSKIGNQKRSGLKQNIQIERKTLTTYKPNIKPTLLNKVDQGRVGKNSSKKQESQQMVSPKAESSANQQQEQITPQKQINNNRTVSYGVPRSYTSSYFLYQNRSFLFGHEQQQRRDHERQWTL